jgi:hypothetical protein
LKLAANRKRERSRKRSRKREEREKRERFDEEGRENDDVSNGDIGMPGQEREEKRTPQLR